MPFDLKTDRYLAYDQNQLGGAVEILAAALKLTMDAQRADSPIYQLLPALKPADPEDVLVVPLDFSEEVERVEAATNCGDLQLLAAEVDGFAWRVAGFAHDRPRAVSLEGLDGRQGHLDRRPRVWRHGR